MNIVLIIDHCWSCRRNLIMPKDPFNFSTAQTSILMAYATFLQHLHDRLNTSTCIITLLYAILQDVQFLNCFTENCSRWVVYSCFPRSGTRSSISLRSQQQLVVLCCGVCSMLFWYFESLRVIELCFLNLAASCLVAQTFVVPQLGSLKPRELRVSSTASLLCPGPILEMFFRSEGSTFRTFP